MLRKFIRWIYGTLKRVLNSTGFGRKLLYDVENVGEFTDLYSHERMLADPARMKAYGDAIRRLIGPGDVVVDLGTGTGVLSFLAAEAGATRIYAVDHSNFIAVARKVAEHNRIGGITFVKSGSREFDPGEKVDVILHEQMGDELFNENMLENILDLKRRLLKASGRVIPGKFGVYLEPVMLREDHRAPFVWEQRIAGADFGFLRGDGILDGFKQGNYDRRYVENRSVEAFLCEPEPVLTFDLNTITDGKEIPAVVETTKIIRTPGRMDGVCLYFDAIFDDRTVLTTSPAGTRTNWGNLLFRTEGKRVDAGEKISFRLRMEDPSKPATWSFTRL